MTNRFVCQHIQRMTPYEPIYPLEILSAQLGIPPDKIVKLDANENAYGMPPQALSRLAALQHGHIYPDPESRRLREQLAALHNLPTEALIVGAGADELIDLIVRLTMNPGDRMINCPPTFGYYDTIAQVNNLRSIQVQRQPDFSVDVEGIRAAVDAGGRLIFLAQPNNPDGSLIPDAVLAEILALPILVILDEAYAPFADEDVSRIHSVMTQDNLIVLRTFSKWGGLAGIRLGYGVFPPSLQIEAMKIKSPYNVSVAASEAGLGALEDLDLLNERARLIREERDRLFQKLQAISFLSPYPSQANFILCRVHGTSAPQLKADLAARGIFIRYFNKPGLQDHIRISVGRPADTDQLIQSLKEFDS